ncbi:MAG: GNAT family N-acetyltransferase [Anaerolineales bacterium]|nr:GNAT family N-acetyltransferase [Anaerolineales bacterium]
MPRPLTFTLTDTPDPANLQVVRDGLNSFNASHGVADDWVQLCIFVHAGNGRVVAGLTGGTYWRWLYVARLWVDDSLRGQGYGSRLMARAEEEAIRRGCLYAYLDTEDFQALAFYEKLGYAIFGELPDCPPGHVRYFVRKTLPAP